jgi:1-acyl-sn-glycerol-3-phosphate acyltransferase
MGNPSTDSRITKVALRSYLFSLIFYLWITISMVVCLPFIFFYPVIYKLNRHWAKSVMWLFKTIVGCDYRIEGLENLPIQLEEKKNDKNLQTSNFKPQTKAGFVIASKHQSAWETIVAFAIFPKVAFVYKKELGYIPIYGWYNIAYRNIKVDRGAGVTSLRKIVGRAKNRVKQGHQVVIFPQGTRTPFGVEKKYKSAVYAMYKEGLPIYPAALNSGDHWPKHGVKRGGTIVWKFFPKIESGLSRDEFMAKLSAVIEVESNALHAKAHKHGAGCGCH